MEHLRHGSDKHAISGVPATLLLPKVSLWSALAAMVQARLTSQRVALVADRRAITQRRAIDGSKFKTVNGRDRTSPSISSRQIRQAEESIARHLAYLDRADRDPSTVTEARMEH
jgi:hypothetical protein